MYDKSIVNLDFHTIPHFGCESVLQEYWPGAINKRMKGALTLVCQDADSKLILCTVADIQRQEADDQILEFLSFRKKTQRGVIPMLIFDSKFTTYSDLFQLNGIVVKFITLRRRGKNFIDALETVGSLKRIHIPHAKRIYQNPQVHGVRIHS